MATRSTISILKEDGKIYQIYAHFDGYISNNGVVLYNYYNDAEKVNELINLGDLSSLNKNIKPTEIHSYEHPQKDVTVFYGRDRGEINIKATKFDNIQMYLLSGDFESYNYVFKEKNNKWFLLDRKNKKLIALKGLIKNNLKEMNPEYKKDFLDLLKQEKEEKALLRNSKNNIDISLKINM